MGILRFLLALSVIASHASGIGIPFPDKQPYDIWAMNLVQGTQSVALFYIISGFYMAMVLNTKYKEKNLKFYLNRFLRLWPTYIIVFILAFIFTPVGTNIVNTLANCGPLVKTYVWFCNLFILGTDSFWLMSIDNCHVHYLPAFINGSSNGFLHVVNPPSFSISIEMLFYIIAPFILRSLKRTWIFFFIGVLYFFYVVLSGNINMIYQYHLFPSSFIYFALGALAWHYSKNSSFVLTQKKIFIILISCIGLMFIYTLFPMIILICFTVMVPRLFELTKNSKTDRLIGELSYPLYILHYPVLSYLWGENVSTLYTGVACFSITLILAIIIHFVVEKPIDNLRQRSFSQS